MNLPEKAYWAAFNSMAKVSSSNILRLVSTFGSAEKAWEAAQRGAITQVFTRDFIEYLKCSCLKLNVEEYYKKIIDSNASIMTIKDKDYPQNLKNIYNPPAVLYFRSSDFEKTIINEIKISVVGTRRPSAYGIKIAERISSKLTSCGVTIISGMARGIDTYAHEGALNGGGNTIAVLGSGIDVVYPRENKKLMEEIIEQGIVFSEFPPGTPPYKTNFPARNRIISGLSSGVLVIEAPEKSGALITTDFALEQGRDVFAVPGPITSKNSRGTNKLIKEGAKLVESCEDILEEYKLDTCGNEAGVKAVENLPKDVEEILNMLSGGPLFLDELCQYTGRSAEELNIILTQLELQGLITKTEGKIHTMV